MKMTILLISGFLLCIAVLMLLIRKAHRRRKERMIQARRDEHVHWLSNRIEELAKKDPTAFGDRTGQAAFTAMREVWGYPPERDLVLEHIVPGDQVGRDRDYAIHIHEGAEQYLGPALFAGLEGEFASIPGVDECRHEDREVFLVRTKSLSADALRDLCWSRFMRAARMAFEKEDKT